MIDIFNHSKFIAELKTFSGKKSLRTCAQEIGISASTLSRISRGNTPDLETFGRICEWMLTSPSEFFHFDWE